MPDRRVWCVLLLVLSLASTSVQLAGGAPFAEGYPNVLSNGDFENGEQEWRVLPLDGAFEIVDRNDGAGQAAALQTAASDRVEIFQPLSIDPDSEYRLSGEVLWTDPNYNYALLRASFKGADGKIRQVRELHAPSAQTSWQQLTSDWLAPPADATRVEIALSVVGGTSAPEAPMLFDNISLEQKLPPTPTTAPTTTPYPHVEIYVNEVLSQPDTDWNGDGSVDTNDEWVELYNKGDSDVDLDEWVIDDGPGGSDPFMLRSLFIRSDGYFVLFSSATGLRLNDSGDQVRLYRSDGALADDLHVPPLDPDQSVGRYPDGGSELSTDWLPTLGKPNGSQGKTPQPTPH
ncbi:MAG: lamin tail domain-containing protein, partial [Chloroflexota bacterium]|nr:lamin tail domain-containing protein [Chloroflexota bacterium]